MWAIFMDKSMAISPGVSIPYGHSLLFEQQRKVIQLPHCTSISKHEKEFQGLITSRGHFLSCVSGNRLKCIYYPRKYDHQ